MEFKELVALTRSYRRFDQTIGISLETLESWAALARLAPSSANLQGLKFLLVSDPELNAIVFKSISFAGYLKEWGGPKEGERPTAYVVILGGIRPLSIILIWMLVLPPRQSCWQPMRMAMVG
jgi:nitroreductase